jgi:hypothetical protein
MSRKRTLKPKPHPDKSIILTKRSVATAQLETAIGLWFERGDPISTLVLAYNAHELIHAIGKTIGTPSDLQAWLETMPFSFQERWRYVNNFCKHAWIDLNEETPHDPRQAEVLMYFACKTYRWVFRANTPLMLAFAWRLLFENPDFAAAESDEVCSRFAKIKIPRESSRQQFLKQWFPLFYSFAGATDFSVGLPRSSFPKSA